jgi:hypothetical protein
MSKPGFTTCWNGLDQILPGTGRWQPEGLTEGARLSDALEPGPLHHFR